MAIQVLHVTSQCSVLEYTVSLYRHGGTLFRCSILSLISESRSSLPAAMVQLAKGCCLSVSRSCS